jgi:hypothetical protein
VSCLIQYYLSAGNHSAQLPDFLTNGCLTKTKTGEIVRLLVKIEGQPLVRLLVKIEGQPLVRLLVKIEDQPLVYISVVFSVLSISLFRKDNITYMFIQIQ